VFLDDPAAQVAAGGHRKTDGAIAGLDLDDQGAEHVQAEALPALAVLGVLGHRRCDVVVDPVAIALVVVVGAGAAQRESADVLDRGHGHGVGPV